MQKISMSNKKGIESHKSKQKKIEPISGIENKNQKYDRAKEIGQDIGEDFIKPTKAMKNVVSFVQGRWKMNRKRLLSKIKRNSTIPNLDLVETITK